MRKTGIILPVRSEFTGAAGMDAKTGQRGQQQGELELCPVHKVKVPGKASELLCPCSQHYEKAHVPDTSEPHLSAFPNFLRVLINQVYPGRKIGRSNSTTSNPGTAWTFLWWRPWVGVNVRALHPPPSRLLPCLAPGVHTVFRIKNPLAIQCF